MPAGDGDVIQGVLNMTMVNGDEAKNIFVFDITKVSVGDWNDLSIGTYVADYIEALFATLIGALRSTMTFDTVDIYKRAGVVWDYLTTVVPVIVPTDLGQVMPPGVAGLLTAYTLVNKVFGRKFIYGITEQFVTDGVLSAAAVTSLVNAAAVYIASWNGGTMGPLDFLNPGVWSTKSVGFEPFSGVAVVKDTLSYQRRRKTGVGV